MSISSKEEQRRAKISIAVSKMTDLNVKKISEAFAMGSTVEEACLYAEISRQTFYNWRDENKDLFDTIESFRLNPILKARKVIMDNLDKGDVKTAMWYLERKKRDEFDPREKNVDINRDFHFTLTTVDGKGNVINS